MGRQKQAEKKLRVTFYLPEHLYAELQLRVYSNVLNAVPHGLMSELYTDLTLKFLRGDPQGVDCLTCRLR